MPKVKWTVEKVSEGFKLFFNEYGKYPTANEIDDYEFLPTSRQIQRSFGGLISLRKIIGLPIEDYASGSERSKVAQYLNRRGRSCEYTVLDLLQRNFKEHFIHIERPVNVNFNMNSKDRFDFYVYANPVNFAIDVFATRDIRCFIKVMNIKEKKYKNVATRGDCLYFVYFSSYDLKSKINGWLSRKRASLPDNWKILNFDQFKEELVIYTGRD
jgi:hypothetical protein